MEDILINRRLNDDQINKIISMGSSDEPILFAICGDISLKAEYSACVLLVTKAHIFSYDFVKDEVSDKYAFDDIEKIYNKRMYGNGIMRIVLKSGEQIDLFRFTLSVATLCDSAVMYVIEVRDGEAFEEAFATMQAAYEKMLSVCPKCGRTLSAPGARCIHCMQKRRIIKKLGVYLKPEMPVIIVALIMIVITTGCNLFPPLLTQFLVDDILPNANYRALIVVVVLLICTHILHYILFGIRNYMLRRSSNKIIARMKTDVYEKAQYLPMRFYDKTSMGSVINRISSDIANIQNFMKCVTFDVIVMAFKLVAPVILMLCINPKLTLLSLIPVPIIVIGSRIFRKKIAPFYHRIWRRSSAVTSVLTDSLPGIRVVKSFTNEKNASDKFASCVEDWRETDTNAGKILSAYPAVVSCLIQLGGIVIWALGGSMVIEQLHLGNEASVTTGMLVSLISYATMFYAPVEFYANF